MPRLDRGRKDAVLRELAGLKGRPLADAVARLAADLDVSRATLYTLSREVRPLRARPSGCPPRARLPEKAWKVVAGIVALGGSVERAVELARANGLVDGAPPAIGTVRAQLRAAGMAPRKTKRERALKPRRRFQAAYPNQLHQVDFTVAPQFYIDHDGSVGFEGPLRRSKNRPGNQRPRLWIYALVDDSSRAAYARFYVRQPTQWTVPDFLFRAWEQKEKDYPFCGMPEKLYCDRDPALTSKIFVRAMDCLGVQVIYHMPGEAQAKGKVERFLGWLIKDQVITRIAKFKCLDDANAYLMEALLYYNNRKHGTTHEIPFHAWLKVNHQREPVRLPPREKIRGVLMLRSFERKVPADLRLHIEGNIVQLPYRAPWINLVGTTIEVLVGPEMTSTVLVYVNQETYELDVRPAAEHQAGDWKGMPETKLQRAMKEAQAHDLSGLGAWGFGSSALRSGSEGRVERPVQAGPSPNSEAFEETRLAGVPGGEKSYDLLDAIAELQREGILSMPVTAIERAIVENAFVRCTGGEREQISAAEFVKILQTVERRLRMTGTD